jgi:hypothetical protein
MLVPMNDSRLTFLFRQSRVGDTTQLHSVRRSVRLVKDGFWRSHSRSFTCRRTFHGARLLPLRALCQTKVRCGEVNAKSFLNS